MSLSELLHGMNPFNLNLANSNYYPLTPTNLTCFPNTSIINLNNTTSNFNNYTSNINYCHFSSLNFYSSLDFYYYTLFSFFFTHRFILLPVILLFLYYLKDLFINCFPIRVDNSNTVDIRESQSSSNSTAPNSAGNQSQGSSASASGASGGDSDGGDGDGGNGGNRRNGGNGGSGDNNWLRSLVLSELAAGLREFIVLASSLNEAYRSASAQIEIEIANIPRSPNVEWFTSHPFYNPTYGRLTYNMPRALMEANSNFTEHIESLLEIERRSRHLNLDISPSDITNVECIAADRAEYNRLRLEIVRLFQHYNNIFQATMR